VEKLVNNCVRFVDKTFYFLTAKFYEYCCRYNEVIADRTDGGTFLRHRVELSATVFTHLVWCVTVMHY